MKGGIFAAGVLAAGLSACATIEAAKVAGKEAADKGADAAYRVTCGLPYPTEDRFLQRNKITRKTIQAWCRRRDAR